MKWGFKRSYYKASIEGQTLLEVFLSFSEANCEVGVSKGSDRKPP